MRRRPLDKLRAGTWGDCERDWLDCDVPDSVRWGVGSGNCGMGLGLVPHVRGGIPETGAPLADACPRAMLMRLAARSPSFSGGAEAEKAGLIMLNVEKQVAASRSRESSGSSGSSSPSGSACTGNLRACRGVGDVPWTVVACDSSETGSVRHEDCDEGWRVVDALLRVPQLILMGLGTVAGLCADDRMKAGECCGVDELLEPRLLPKEKARFMDDSALGATPGTAAAPAGACVVQGAADVLFDAFRLRREKESARVTCNKKRGLRRHGAEQGWPKMSQRHAGWPFTRRQVVGLTSGTTNVTA